MKFLIQSVYWGVLPNFFIPQNFIFAGKWATADGEHALKLLSEKLIWYHVSIVSCLHQHQSLNQFYVIEIWACYVTTDWISGLSFYSHWQTYRYCCSMIRTFIRDTSWHILEICQHVVGDLHGSFKSYQESQIVKWKAHFA